MFSCSIDARELRYRTDKGLGTSLENALPVTVQTCLSKYYVWKISKQSLKSNPDPVFIKNASCPREVKRVGHDIYIYIYRKAENMEKAL